MMHCRHAACLRGSEPLHQGARMGQLRGQRVQRQGAKVVWHEAIGVAPQNPYIETKKKYI